MTSDVTRAEFTEVQIQQRLLQQAFATIAENTTEIRKSVQEFTAIAGRMEELIEHVEEVRDMATKHEQELAVMRSHKIVEKVNAHENDMPGLREIRRWVIGGVLAIVGSTWIAAAAIIFH